MRLIIILTLAIPLFTAAQVKKPVSPTPKKEYFYYRSNGERYTLPKGTINSIKGIMEALGTDYLGGSIINGRYTWYKPLSQEVVLIEGTDSIDALTAIKKISYENYRTSYDFKYDFSKLVDLNYTINDVIKLIGKPADSTEIYSWRKSYDFPDRKLEIITENGKLSELKRADYSGALKNKLGVISFEINLSDLDDDYVTGFKIAYLNASDKRIKYIYTTVTAYNAVNDVVNSKTATSIGPVDASDIGSYSFEKLWYSSIISNIRITGVKVLYYDGTTKTFNPAAVKQLFTNIDR